MDSNLIKDIHWYQDMDASERQEPGIYHSYMAGLATALNYLDKDFDPVWLMGVSAFAFRTFVNEGMCPSAMSIFDWSGILPEAIEQAGYDCLYIERVWGQEALEEERRHQAQSAIIEHIDLGIPAIVWDIDDCEWGLIIGYDQKNKIYTTLTNRGRQSTLPFDKLGQNGINILSAAIPRRKNDRNKSDIIRSSLQTAVDHAEQKEWIDSPQYQNGLAAYNMWAGIYEKWHNLPESMTDSDLAKGALQNSKYYAGHHYSARCYARDYLKSIAEINDNLLKASDSFGMAAAELRNIWQISSRGEFAGCDQIDSMVKSLNNAHDFEARGIEFIKNYLSQ